MSRVIINAKFDTEEYEWTWIIKQVSNFQKNYGYS
jgi:hypothetical protein